MKTPEIVPSTADIAKKVKSAFDSVTVIEEIKKNEKPTAAETDRLKRNADYLKDMLKHAWFRKALSKSKREKINKAIE